MRVQLSKSVTNYSCASSDWLSKLHELAKWREMSWKLDFPGMGARRGGGGHQAFFGLLPRYHSVSESNRTTRCTADIPKPPFYS